MKLRPGLIPVILVILVGLAGGAWYLSQPANVFRPTGVGDLRASGTFQADEAAVTAELGGRVTEILVREGDTVAANAPLARLDVEAATADLARAQGGLAEAQARRDLARNGARPEDKAAADAGLAQAVVARDGAKRAWDNMIAILNNPQELNARIDSARAQVTLAAQQIDAAKTGQAQAEASRDKYRGDGSDLGKTMFASLDLQVQAAQESILAATAQRDGTQAALNDLLAVRANPIDLRTQVHQAEARYHDAERAVDIAQAARDLVYAGATKQDLAAAEAAVAQAQAAVNAAQIRLDKLTLRAPAAGLVSRRSIDLGQVIAPGVNTFTLVNPSRLTLTVYFPETEIGKVQFGQAVRVFVDAFPRQTFSGHTVFISSQAEFTPKNVQTAEGRVSQVFAVKIRLDSPEQGLKPGMAADAVVSRP